MLEVLVPTTYMLLMQTIIMRHLISIIMQGMWIPPVMDQHLPNQSKILFLTCSTLFGQVEHHCESNNRAISTTY